MNQFKKIKPKNNSTNLQYLKKYKINRHLFMFNLNINLKKAIKMFIHIYKNIQIKNKETNYTNLFNLYFNKKSNNFLANNLSLKSYNFFF